VSKSFYDIPSNKSPQLLDSIVLHSVLFWIRDKSAQLLSHTCPQLRVSPTGPNTANRRPVARQKVLTAHRSGGSVLITVPFAGMSVCQPNVARCSETLSKISQKYGMTMFRLRGSRKFNFFIANSCDNCPPNVHTYIHIHIHIHIYVCIFIYVGMSEWGYPT